MKDGKLFGKINIIDFLVLIVIIIVGIGIAFRFSKSSSGGMNQKQDFEYTVRVDNVRDYTVLALEKMGKVFSEKTDVYIGDIVDIKTEPYLSEAVTYSGERKFLEKPERYTVYVTIKGSGTDVNGKIFDSNKDEPAPGRDSKICTKYVSTSGKVVDLNAD